MPPAQTISVLSAPSSHTLAPSSQEAGTEKNALVNPTSPLPVESPSDTVGSPEAAEEARAPVIKTGKADTAPNGHGEESPSAQDPSRAIHDEEPTEVNYHVLPPRV